jgi:hypothetical protein
MSQRPTDRRAFFGQLATTAAMFSVAGCASSASASALGAQATAQPGSPWDDSWFGRITADHRAVFDMPAIDDGMGIAHVNGYLRAMKDIHGADAQAVLVIRHAALPIALNDAMWEKYGMGRIVRNRDKSSEPPAAKNDYLRSLGQLHSRGVILLACDLAARGYASLAASSPGVTAKQPEIHEEFKRNLAPGVILQPTGVYAVHRAQEAKCTFIRSSE